jgi:hypothetical protein
MKKLKILIPIALLTLLFLISFALQTRFNTLVANHVNIETAESFIGKQVLILGNSFAFLNLLIFSIVLCFSVMFVILVLVLVNRTQMERHAKLKSELTEIYQSKILDALDDKEMTLRELTEFKKICNSRFRKAILIDQIIDVALILPKDKMGKLREFYLIMGLLQETERKLKNRKWHNKIKAMKELSHLEIKDYNSKILEYVNEKNDTLRMEAQIAMVRLSDDKNPFMFLEHLDHEFSTWEQITLYELMVEAEITPPDFSKWLVSDNHSVGMFCLRMMREYKQVHNLRNLENMLYHPNEKVARFATEVVGDLGIVELAPAMKKLYKGESFLNKMEIVKSLGKFGNSKYIKFLQHIVDSEEDTQLQIEGVKAIRACDNEGQIALQKMLDSDYRDYKIIIKHVLDNRIN